MWFSQSIGLYADSNAKAMVPVHSSIDQIVTPLGDSFGITLVKTVADYDSLEICDTDNMTEYNALLKIEGNDFPVSTKSSITLNAALELVNKAGVKVGVPGAGEVSNETELKAAFGGSATKEVMITMTSSFTAYYDATLEVTGLGRINVTVE